MNRLKFMGIIAIVGLLFMPAAVISAPAGPPGGLAVQIINTTPVMVSGEVALTNTVEDPLPVEGSLQVWQDLIPVHSSHSVFNFGGNFETVYTVPEGRRLVIEYLTFRTLLPPNENATVKVSTILNGEEADHWMGITEGTPYNTPVSTVADPSMNFLSKSVKLYADPCTDVVFYFYNYSNIGYPFIDFSISGYLESIN